MPDIQVNYSQMQANQNAVFGSSSGSNLTFPKYPSTTGTGTGTGTTTATGSNIVQAEPPTKGNFWDGLAGTLQGVNQLANTLTNNNQPREIVLPPTPPENQKTVYIWVGLGILAGVIILVILNKK